MACVDNVWVRMMVFKSAGMKNDAHLHTHDHASMLAAGRVKVTVDGSESEFKAPCLILVHKDQVHQLEALEDNTVVCCIHGLRDKETGDLWPSEAVPKGSILRKLKDSEARTRR